jgi:protein subunit release factor A
VAPSPERDDRNLLFRVTAKDFTETHIRGSGPGGQHRNKTATGIRLVHKASGAVGEATDDKSQHVNRANAFKRLREDERWKAWFRDMVLTTQGRETPGDRLERLMDEANITTQILDERSRWVDVDPSVLH